MSAPVLTVDRLHATVRGSGPAAARLGALVPRLAGDGLEADLADLPAGHWCLQALDVGVALDPDLPAAALVAAWARAVGAAVRGAGGVVHYRHELDALTDLVAELAAGRPERAWAWAQIGLVPPGTPALVPALCARPDLAVPALATAVRRRGLAAVDRALGPAGWATVAHAIRPERPDVRPARSTPAAWRRARRVLAGSTLAAAVHRSGLRPDAVTARAWAVLVTAEADPTGAERADAGAVLAVLAEALSTGPGRRPARPEDAATVPNPTGPEPTPAGVVADGLHTATVAPEPPLGRRDPEPGSAAHAPADVGRTAVGEDRPEHRATPIGLRAEAVRTGPRRPLPVEDGPHPQGNPSGPRTRAPGSPAPARAADVTPTDRRPPVAPPAPQPAASPGAPGADPDAPAGLPTAWAGLPRAPGSPAPARAADVTRTDRRPPVAPPAPQPAASPGAPGADPDAPAGLPTAWAGLPFLLATAADAGLPGCVLDDVDLAARPLPWVLHYVGRTLVPVEAGDPALLALAGLDPRRARLLLDPTDPSGAGPTAPERAGIERVAERWRTATAARLHDAGACGPPETSVHRVARRPGRVYAEPGWVEIHLLLADVDPVLRRAGLDVDPGWVAFLGAVVRYRYE